jgi:hypothetical protein
MPIVSSGLVKLRRPRHQEKLCRRVEDALVDDCVALRHPTQLAPLKSVPSIPTGTERPCG